MSALWSGTEVRACFRAMGSRFCVAVRAQPAHERQARSAIVRELAWIRQVERRLSRFDPASELSRLNARSGSWCVVSPLLFQALKAAEAAHRLTGGLFDPAVLPALLRWGYDRDWNQLRCRAEDPRGSRQKAPEVQPAEHGPPGPTPRPATPTPASAARGWQLDPLARAVWLADGVSLDLGGIVKGLVADAVAERLARTFPAALVDAGGDIAAVAWPGLPPWRIRLPEELGRPAIVRVWRGAVATSATTRRRWNGPLGPAHHLIDPRTGAPACSGVELACVVARSAAVAEVLAKALIIGGPEAALPSLKRQAPVEARWRTRDGEVERWPCRSGWC